MSSQSSGSEQEKGHEQLIEAVKKHEILYKADHDNYRDKNLRQKAWEQVVAECGIATTVEGAKSRWKYLRDSFAETHKKQIRQNWRYRKQMEFLLPYVVYRKRNVNKLNKGDDVVDLTADEPDLINQNDYSQFLETTDDEHQSVVNGNIALSEKQSNNFELYTQIPVVNQKDDHQKAVNEKTVQNLNPSKDYELYKFFMVMYKEVLQFPDRTKVDVKKRIFKAVTAEEFNNAKENGVRKRSLDVSPNNLPIRKSKGSNSTADTAKASKNLPSHSKNKESHFVLSKANSSVTNFSNAISNELNSLPKPSTSSIVTNVFSNQVHIEPKNKELELNVMPFSSTVSVATTESAKTINIPNQLHNELLQRLGPHISIKVPKTPTANNTSMFSHPPQTYSSLPKISSAIKISPDAFSQELKTDHSKSQKSELPPTPTVPPLQILNNLNVGTTLVISNVSHIEELRDNGFENNLKSPKAGCSASNNKDTYSNKLQSIESSQNKEAEFSFKNVPSIGVNPTSTLNAISVTSDKKIVDEQNVEKPSPINTMNVEQTTVLSINSVDTFEKNEIKKADKKDKSLLSLPAASYSDVAEIVLSDED